MNPLLLNNLEEVLKDFPIGSFCYHKANEQKGVVNAYRVDCDYSVGIEVDFGDACQSFPIHCLTNKKPLEGVEVEAE